MTSVHLTETCDASSHDTPEVPHLIVQVQTTVATVQDVEVTEEIQEDLAQHSLLPDEQLVDTGYVDADLLESLQHKYGIKLLGPVLSDNSWQAKADKGFDAAHFQIDWRTRGVTCPQGQQSHRWTAIEKPERIEVVFARQTCAVCPARADCTQSQTTGRVLHLRPPAPHQALQARRADQQTAEFRKRYARRAGIEGTLSQGVRRMGLRRARYDGLQKTHLQHILTATALNVVRIDAFLTHTPRGQTRRSHFANLATHAVFQQGAA